MRILLQQIGTELYFKDIGEWVEDSTEAMDFVGSTAAIEFCILNKLANVHLVLKFDEQKCDIVLPMEPRPDLVRQRPTA